MDAIDMDMLERAARTRWLKESAPRASLGELLGRAVPYFVIVTFLAGYTLSAPHTSAVLDMLTPGFGFVAPVMVELSLIYAAFARRRAKLQGEQPGAVVAVLRWLMFGVAVVTNLAGGLSQLVEHAAVDGMSAGAVWAEFDSLPLVVQAGFLMAIFMAVVIPVTCEVAGHGVAELAFGRRTTDNRLDDAWAQVAFEHMARLAYVQLMRAGQGPDDARRLAVQTVRGYLAAGSGRAGGRTGGQRPDTERTDGGRTEPVRSLPDSGRRTAQADKRTLADEWLVSHPAFVGESVRTVTAAMRADGLEIGRTTVNEALAARKESGQ